MKGVYSLFSDFCHLLRLLSQDTRTISRQYKVKKFFEVEKFSLNPCHFSIKLCLYPKNYRTSSDSVDDFYMMLRLFIPKVY